MLSFSTVDHTTDPRSTLSPLADDPRFAWLNPILKSTLTDATETFLNGNRPERLAYDPADAERLLGEAGSRMKYLTDLEREIHATESQAMLMALDYALADALRESDFRLAKLRLKADRRMGDADDNDPSEAEMNDRYEVVNSAFNLKLALHNTPNGSLNFGERVAVLREKFVRELKAVYEILLTVRIGAATSFNIKTPQLPLWNTTANVCYALDAWCLSLSDQFEKAKKSEIVIDVFYSLCADRCCSLDPAQLSAMLRTEEFTTIDFVIDRMAGDTQLNFLGTATGFYRLLAVGACVQVGDPTMELETKAAKWREDYTAPAAGAEFTMTNALNPAQANRRESVSLLASIRLPEQNYRAMDDQIERDIGPRLVDDKWHRPDLSMGALPIWEQGPVSQAMSLSGGRQVRNAQPFGRWRISISNRYLSRSGTGKLKALYDDSYYKLAISDIVIGLRIAITASE